MSLQTALRGLTRLEKLPKRMTRRIAMAVRQEILRTWNLGQDPYGKKWAPLKDGRSSVLQRTGKMKKSLTIRTSGPTIRVKISTKYSRFHQTGTSCMPKRKLVPDNGYPASWVAALTKAFKAAQ